MQTQIKNRRKIIKSDEQLKVEIEPRKKNPRREKSENQNFIKQETQI